MAKAEISWKRKTEEGEKFEVYVHHVGNQWKFFQRSKRYDNWMPYSDPALIDWMELYDAVQRRAARRLMRPEDVEKVRRAIRDRFPEAELE